MRPEKNIQSDSRSVNRFLVKNLDCAACAAKIETGLKQTRGVEEAVLDFANLTLHLKAEDIAEAVAAVRRIDPGIELVAMDRRPAEADLQSASEAQRRRKDAGLLAVAGFLFILHLVFEERFHASPWAWAEYLAALAAYLLAGWNVLAGAFRTIRRGDFFDENVLMVIATGGAFAIHALSEAVGVMLFYKAGELLQELSVSRSRRSIRSLLAVRPERAWVRTLSGWVEMHPEKVKTGEIILVKPGEKVPLDGKVITGASQLDTSPLTGESVPVSAAPGDAVLAGSVNLSAALTVRVGKPFLESSIAKVLELVQNAAARKARTEKFITSFARYYTPAVVLIAAGIAVLPPLLIPGAAFEVWIYRALVLLVISCPCALVVSIPLGYFGGIGRASRQGILVKGSNFIDALARVKTVVFDKTGTLTHGVFEVGKIITLNGYTEERLLTYAAAAEMHSDHPIGKSIVRALEEKGLRLDPAGVSDHAAIGGLGVSATYAGSRILVGSDSLLHKEEIGHDRCEFTDTVAHVVVDGEHAGYLLIGDRIKPDAAGAIERLRGCGVDRMIMLTGDNSCTAQHVAGVLGLDRFHAGLLPEDKVKMMEEILAESNGRGKVAFVGDGINDAPVLARADVGVAMGALGSDAAVETADVVLMTDSPAKMAEAVEIARKTRKIVWQNIILALGVKGVFIVFGAFGLATMWEAVFADMGTALAAVLNSTRTLGGRVF